MPLSLFGTDGIRGRANKHPVTSEIMLKVAMAAGRRFRREGGRNLVVIGKDTRLSGYTLEPALTAGFTAMGMDVVLSGPLPTPAVAMLARSLRADLGVMISASHNPFDDNGVKIFGPDGFKISDAEERGIERDVESGVFDDVAAPALLGRAMRLDDAPGRYIECVKHSFPRHLRLDGLRLVVDTANGAGYRVGPAVFTELGADVVAVGNEPDGININRLRGALAPEVLAAEVRGHNADLGIALDGDGDRVLLVDEKGGVVDGDQIIAFVASSWQRAGRLEGRAVAGTILSNLGLERHLKALGLKVIRTPVGDRHVLEAMRRHGLNFGGEQSGHLIFLDHATTGDGLVAALQVLAELVVGNAPASEALRVFPPLPQLTRSVRAPRAVLERGDISALIGQAERRLGAIGRVIVRPSGTEPVIRVMAEGEDQAEVASVVEEICGALGRTPAVAAQ